jgi:hypothetical protein
MLAVSPVQTLSAIEEGLERHFSFRRSSRSGKSEFLDLVVPSPALLRLFYMSHPGFILQDDLLHASEPVTLDLLGDETRYMVELVKEAPHQAMSRLDLLEACTKGGMNSSTVNLWLTYSECFEQLAPNVWGLRGVKVPQQVVEEIQDQAKEQRKATDHRVVKGWTTSGHAWMARCLTSSQIFSRVLPFDWAKDLLEDVSLRAIDIEDGVEVGTLRFGGGFNWGYSRYFSKHRVRPGDVIRVTADLESHVAYLEIGGDELLDAPFDM